MITGRKIANGNNGNGETLARKTPLMAADQATAAQSVNGTMIASQVVRRVIEFRWPPPWRSFSVILARWLYQ